MDKNDNKIRESEQLCEMLLRRKHKLNLETGIENTWSYGEHEEDEVIVKQMVTSIAKNVQALGFIFGSDVYRILLNYPKEKLTAFYQNLMAELKPLVGADKKYRPMYPNFPQQVAEADDAELFINALIHYLTYGTVVRGYEKSDRIPLFEDTNMTELTLGGFEDIAEIFTHLVGSKTNLSQQDKDDIAWFVHTYADYGRYLPDEVPLKENVALIGKLIIEQAAVKDAAWIQKYFKTSTDVLRLVTALSDGDLSLAKQTKYRKLKRPERRMVMDLLAGCGTILEDMFRYQYEWIRIGEIVHPSEYTAEKYQNVRNAFDVLRNEKKPQFVPGLVQACVLDGEVEKAAHLLQKRPGDFARQLDKLLREAKNPDDVLNCFQKVIDEVSTPVLLQLRQHFADRNKNLPIRVFFPKGNLARAYSIPNDLPEISESVCALVDKMCQDALCRKFSDKPKLGKVYVDPELSSYLVPFSQRSASSAGKSLVRGSRVKLNPNAKVVRGFIWWTNTDDVKMPYGIISGSGRVDIDLSAVAYDADWNYKGHISYTNLRDRARQAYHSGDITNGGPIDGKGVSEFIDFNIDKLAESGRYIAFQVYSFTRQRFCDLPNCRFGWMERENVNSGEIFEPSTVDMNIDVNAESTIAIPVIFDCVEKEFIWCDLNMAEGHRTYGGNNLESNLSGVTAVCYSMANISKPDLFTLARLNGLSRGEMVRDRNDADIIFSNDTTPPVVRETVVSDDGTITDEIRVKEDIKIITAYDLDYIMSELL